MQQDFLRKYSREFVTRYTTDLDGDNTVYTDDNGLELQTRVYNTTASDLVAGKNIFLEIF